MRTRILRALRLASDRGASAVEYGLMVAAIAAVIVGVVFGLGSVVHDAFGKTCDRIGTSTPIGNTDCSINN
jgi:pilus assembly protein Flp/PilA